MNQKRAKIILDLTEAVYQYQVSRANRIAAGSGDTQDNADAQLEVRKAKASWDLAKLDLEDAERGGRDWQDFIERTPALQGPSVEEWERGQKQAREILQAEGYPTKHQPSPKTQAEIDAARATLGLPPMEKP